MVCDFGIATLDGTNDLDMVSFVVESDVMRYAFVLFHVDITLAKQLHESLLFTKVVKVESTIGASGLRWFLLPAEGGCSVGTMQLGKRPD
jgi:hypothetical protein